MYVYQPLHVRISIHISTCKILYLSKIWVHTCTSNTNPLPQGSLNSLSCLSVISPSNSETECPPFTIHGRRLLRVPWTERRSIWSILKEINPQYSLEGLMLKHQHFGHQKRRADSLEKTLMLGKMEDKRRRGLQRMKWLTPIGNNHQV